MEEQGFIVSALKYRPSIFSEVVGQEGITSTLQNAIANEELAKAYLFCGPRGVGKTTSARIFAKAINEKYVPEGTDLSFNIFELDAASHNGVDHIRELIDQVRIQPPVGKYKVYIIDEVHMLSSQAFNAFLKTLEEPPPHAIFILATTEKHKVLPTILSRCQIYDFKRIGIDDIVRHLEEIAQDQGVTFEPEALHLIASKADGALRDALSLFDQMVSFTRKQLTYEAVAKNLNVLDHSFFLRLTEMIKNGAVQEAMKLYDEVDARGFDSLHFLLGVAEHFRNILVSQNPNALGLLQVPDSLKAALSEQARYFQPKELVDMMSILSDTETKYRAAKNKHLLTEITLMKLCRARMADTPVAEKKNEPDKETTSITQQLKQTSTGHEQMESAGIGGSESVHKESHSEIKPESEFPDKKEEVPTPHQDSKNPPAAVVEADSDVLSITSFQLPPTPIVEESEQSLDKPQAPSESEPSNPQNRKRPSRRLSLSDMEEEESAKAELKPKLAEGPEDTEGIEIDEPKLTKAWQAYATKMQEEKKFGFHSLLSNKNPEILDERTIQIQLENDVQREELDREKQELMTFIRAELNHPGIRLEVKIEIEKAESVAFRTPKDQYKAMLEKNPTLKKMSQQFDLDLDF